MGRQVAALPREVTVIHSELENFPYQRLRKSERITVVKRVHTWPRVPRVRRSM